MEWVKNINPGARIAYLLALTEKLMEKIENEEGYKQTRKTIDMCWEWVEEKKHGGEDLYEKLEDDEGEEGLFIVYIEEIDSEVPNIDDPQVKQVFDCVLYAVSYTTRKAYLFDNKENHIPQTVSIVTDEFMDDEFMKKIAKLDGYQESLAESLKQYLLEHLMNPKSPDILSRI